jgi:hypothetical protein
MPRAPDADDGPQRFIRRWLTFDDNRPVRLRKIWMLAATVLVFVMASAMLAWCSNPTPK